MPQTHVVRSFASLLPDVNNLHVVSRLQRSKGPTPEEQVEMAKDEARQLGQMEGYMAGLENGRRDGLKSGYEEAYAKAHAEATEKCNRELEGLFSILAGHVAAVNAELPKWFENAEEEMTDRTMTILRRLLNAELSLGRDHALEIVKECLAEVTHAHNVRIRMNPFDAVVVSQHREQLLALTPQLKNIDFVDDPSIVGGCIVESEGGAIDARFKTRLSLVEGDLAA